MQQVLYSCRQEGRRYPPSRTSPARCEPELPPLRPSNLQPTRISAQSVQLEPSRRELRKLASLKPAINDTLTKPNPRAFLSNASSVVWVVTQCPNSSPPESASSGTLAMLASSVPKQKVSWSA